MPQVLIALGSNIGDRRAHLFTAFAELGKRLTITATSFVYETEPMYVTDQPPFLNAALSATTEFSPRALLGQLKAVEADMGRRCERRYGPREIDVDLIAYGSLRYRYTTASSVELEVPHPGIVERRFVLAPLADVAGSFELPGLGTISELLLRTEQQSECVKRVDGVFSIHSNG